MKGHCVKAFARGRMVNIMNTKDYATAVMTAGSWSKRVDFVEDGAIVQEQPESVQLIDLDANTARTLPGGSKW